MSDSMPTEVLTAVPIFPLPNTVLLPGTFLSLHIFEPRYRAMMEYTIEGHRHMVVALLQTSALPDAEGRPAVHSTAGLGALRRSVRLPDGRYNIVLEGVGRVDISHELPPELVFRRAHAEALRDHSEGSPADHQTAMASVRALCQQAVMSPDPELADRLNRASDPGLFADLVAAAAFKSPQLRQEVLAEARVQARLELVAGGLGELVLAAQDLEDDDQPPPSWGISPGRA